MTKRLQEYVKYTKAELESYISTQGSCVHKVNTKLHYALDPYVLADLKKALPAYILKHEISYYDEKLQGVVLAVKNIKVLNGVAALRTDDPHLHIDINADCYVFRPMEGAELTGVIKHIGKNYVSLVLYRVFVARITFEGMIDKEQLKLGEDLKFRVRTFCLNGIFVNIQGEILSGTNDSGVVKAKTAKKISFNDEERDNDATPDSGIDEENRLIELDELLNSIKTEFFSDEDNPMGSNAGKKAVKQKSKKKESTANLTETSKSSTRKTKRKLSTDVVPPNVLQTDFSKKIKKEKED